MKHVNDWKARRERKALFAVRDAGFPLSMFQIQGATSMHHKRAAPTIADLVGLELLVPVGVRRNGLAGRPAMTYALSLNALAKLYEDPDEKET
jgi:hypothetical protein